MPAFLQMTGNTVVIEHGGGLKAISSTWIPLACKQGDIVEKKNSLSGRRAARAIPQARTCTRGAHRQPEH